MPIIELSQSDILRSTLVEPAWYELLLGETSEKESKDGQSINYSIESEVVKNADDGSEDFAGVPITLRFNSKAPGFFKGFFEALGEEVVAGKRMELAACAGKRIVALIEHNEFQGQMSNRCNHKYRTAS
jgi:hypothetical protein